MTGQHRDDAPLRVRLRRAVACWWSGHPYEDLPSGRVQCTRCERVARTPVDLP